MTYETSADESSQEEREEDDEGNESFSADETSGEAVETGGLDSAREEAEGEPMDLS